MNAFRVQNSFESNRLPPSFEKEREMFATWAGGKCKFNLLFQQIRAVCTSTESTEAHFILQNTRYLPNLLAYLSKSQGITSRLWKITRRIW